MDVRAILASLDNSYDSDLEALFRAIFKAELPSEYVLGEARQLNNLKEVIKKNSDDTL